MFGSTLGLIRRPAAMLAAWASLIGFSLLFNIIYGGQFRHQALWLVFLISLYWIAFQEEKINESFDSTKTRPMINVISKSGYLLLMALLAWQVISFVRLISIKQLQPESRSKDLGLLISKNPDLQDAIIIADPDVLLEPLSFYVKNRTYLMRERRFGNVAIFTKNADLQLSLNDILSYARKLRTEFGKPVVILLHHRLEVSKPEQIIKEGYNWELSITPEQVKTFQASTRFIKRLDPTSSDESYDVYIFE
jgi:hypothetical protein